MNPASIFGQAASRLGALLAILAFQSAVAQDPTAPEMVVDPPERVARLSYLEGRVSLAPVESEAWADAELNRPLTSGDRLWLDRDARAELEVGSATLHLDHSTGFGFVQLDDAVMQMSLTEGAATIRVRELAERAAIQVETPNAAVLLRRPGEYYFETEAGGDRTIVRARSGEVEIRGGAKSYVLRANQEGVFTGLEDLRAKIGPIAPRTAFETWAYDRARREDHSASSRYVSRDVIGYEDLDDYGEWSYDSAYGNVWRPLYVGHGWAPYRFGRWVWILPWGWTWIDDARWGFAPFHYGRWAHLRNHWCWVPGPRHVRPVYAPALVAWVGRPPARYVASVDRDVGWFPLAPHEVYVPSYRHTPRHIRRVNRSNTVIPDDAQIVRVHTARDGSREYRHRDNTDAVTVVQQDRFIGGRPVGEQRLRVSARELREARDSPRPAAIAPNRDSTVAPEPRSDRSIAAEPRSDRPSDRANSGDEESRPGRVAERDKPSTPRAAGDVVRQSPRTSSPATSYARPQSSPQAPSTAAKSTAAKSTTAKQSNGQAARQSAPARQSPQSQDGSRSSYQQR